MRIERQWIRVILIILSTLLLLSISITLLTFGIMDLTKTNPFNLIEEVESILSDKNHSESDSILEELYKRNKDEYLEFKNSKNAITEIDSTSESIINAKDIYLKADSVSPFKDMLAMTDPIINIESSIIDAGVNSETKDIVNINIKDSIIYLHDINDRDQFEFKHIEISNSIFIINDYNDSSIDAVDITGMDSSLFVYGNASEDGISSKHYAGEKIGSSYLDRV